MAFHHVAITTRDLEASNRFYTEAMGFELVKVDVIPFLEGGWARHLFYDTGNGELIALWDLHDDDLGDFDPAISTGLGLPNFVNHIAFGAADLDDLDARKDRLARERPRRRRASTTAGARRSTRTTRAGSWSSSARRRRVLGEEHKREAQRLLAATAPEISTRGTEDRVLRSASRDHAGVS